LLSGYTVGTCFPLWRRGEGGGRRVIASLSFSPSEYFSLVGKLFPKIQNLGLKIPHFGEFVSKVEILFTRIGNLQTSVGKLKLSVPHYSRQTCFLSARRRWNDFKWWLYDGIYVWKHKSYYSGRWRV